MVGWSLLPTPLYIAARRPLAALDRFAVSCADAEIAPHPGSLASPPEIPRGWRVNRHEVVIGEGREAYRRARAALQRLDFMRLPWLDVTVRGDVLAICSRQFGCAWLLNANRLLERSSGRREATLRWATSRRHVLVGEERIAVRWDARTDAVTFSVLSFSRPRHLISAVSYPLVLLQQRRFARDAGRVMVRAGGSDG